MHTTPLVSVVICAYTENRWELLCGAVRSVRNQTVPADQIIVVIDHNDFLFRRAAADERFSGVTLVPNSGPAGLSGARNSGVAGATGEVIAFLDDDAAAAPDWLALLLDPYADPRVIGVGGRIDAVWPRQRPARLAPELDWVVGCTYRGMPTTAAPVRNMIGANMSFHRRVFDEVGGFRVGMGRTATQPLGCEETELCIRATAILPNSRIMYEPAAAVDHHVSADRVTRRYVIARAKAEGVSKADVSAQAGAGAALHTERRYVASTLPRAVVRGVAESARARDTAGLRRAAMIVTVLTVTAAHYGRRRIRLALNNNRRDDGPLAIAAQQAGSTTP
ncbi:MAG TPA: glycosyltransferase [Pseudonocardiaceae bacterium]|nr:glycosyltransferase [Pseudonocardiaceae bacterium]